MGTDELQYPGRWTLDVTLEQALRLFLERAEEFQAEGLFRWPVQAEICIRHGEAYTDTDLPTTRQLRVSAQVARLFIQDKEPTHFYKICKALYSAADDRRFRDAIGRVRKRYSTLLNSRLNPETGVPGIDTHEDLVKAFFNGHYFHSDEAARPFVMGLETAPWGPLLKQAFAQTLIGIYHNIRELVPIIKNALGFDQLAPCDTSKKVQEVLTAAGLGPALIRIRKLLDGSTEPPTIGLICDLDVLLPPDKVHEILKRVLAILSIDKPGYTKHVVAWIGSDGRPLTANAEGS